MKNGDIIIDVSKHNGIVDWDKVSKNVSGVILKATEGATVMDKRFFTNALACRKIGLPWGAYHFATWNNENEELDATSEANFFLSVVKQGGSTSLPLWLDVESNNPIPYTKQEMEAYVKTFITIVENEGFEIGIYASPGFLNSYFAKDHPFGRLKLWVADYTGAINPVPGWKKPYLHQYTDKGTVNGINGSVDMNRVL